MSSRPSGPKPGPACYFPPIETTSGRSVARWRVIIACCGLGRPMAIVEHLTTEYLMGHGHVNARVG